jgi:hypothetical protein
MSTSVILWTIAVIIVIAIVAALAIRARKRRTAARTHIGLPDLGALSTEGLDKEHTAHGARQGSEE